MYADDLALRGEPEDDLTAMVGCFVYVCRRTGLNVDTNKIKVMMLNGEEVLECGFCVERIRLGHVTEFKYLGYVLDKSSTD